MCTLSGTLFFSPSFFVLYVPAQSKVKNVLYAYYYTGACCLRIAELPQLPLLLLLKLRVRIDSFAGIAAGAVRHRVRDGVIGRCGLLRLIPKFLVV